MSKLSKISIGIGSVAAISFLVIKSLIVLSIVEYTRGIGIYELSSVLLSLVLVFILIYDLRKIGIDEKIARKSIERLLNQSSLVSRADSKGKITYVNEMFCKLSGYKEHELLGKDHSILNSGEHPRSFWNDMYQSVIRYRSIWQDEVINLNKEGENYIVQSWIAADFDQSGKHIGYTSVRHDITKMVNSMRALEEKSNDLSKKNTYLEHAAKILRHDMHSGINTYIPRGIRSLKRRLDPELIKELKLESPLKMLEEGLKHTQKVYVGVREFTNIVKEGSKIETLPLQLDSILNDYLYSTAYKNQVKIEPLPIVEVNESLFCTAIDNLIRNGLKYNDSPTKWVKIYMEGDFLAIEDNGRGLTQDEFEHLSKPYIRKEGQAEGGSGLGLNICVAIMSEHGFTVSCERLDNGTKFKIKIIQHQND